MYLFSLGMFGIMRLKCYTWPIQYILDFRVFTTDYYMYISVKQNIGLTIMIAITRTFRENKGTKQRGENKPKKNTVDR